MRLPWQQRKPQMTAADVEAIASSAVARAVAELEARQVGSVEQIERAVKKAVSIVDGLPPSAGIGYPMVPGSIQGRYPLYQFDRPWSYAIGQAPTTRPGSWVTTWTLRQISDTYDGLRACIEHIKREVSAVPIKIGPRGGYKSKISAAMQKRIDRENEWFSEMHGGLGGRGQRRSHFEAEIIEDLCVIGACAVYYQRNRRGDLMEVVAFDSSTVRPVVDAYGWIPDGKNIAYEQWIEGIRVASFEADEILYDGVGAVTTSPYFKSPVEYLVHTIHSALRADEWNRTWLTDGTTASDMLALPESWTPEQIASWQQHWNGMLEGNSAKRQQTKFVPSGTQNVTGGNSRKDQDFQEFELWLLRRTCFDDQTEILTDQGWKRFSELDRSERVATRSKSGEFQWQAPTAYIAKPHEGMMVEFKGVGTDCLVTPDHNMLTQFRHNDFKIRRTESAPCLRRADELVGKRGYWSPMTSTWQGLDASEFVLPSASYKHGLRGGGSEVRVVPEIRIPMSDWCAFMGIWLAEGSAYTYRVTDTATLYRVSVAQADSSPDLEDIRSLLNRLPFRWRRSGHEFICSDIRLNRYLKQFGKAHEKYFPRELLDQSAENISILLDWFARGDGSEYVSKCGTRKKQTVITTSSKQLAGGLQEIAQKIGLDASVSRRACAGDPWAIRGKSGTIKHDVYAVRIRSSEFRTLCGRKVEYSGMVYCVEVPNGVIYTRRNGKPLWAGNCAIMGVSPASIGFAGEQYKVAQEGSQKLTTQFGIGRVLDFRKAVYDAFLVQRGCDDLEVTNVSNVEEEAGSRASRNVQMVSGGLKTINEARAEDGLDPVAPELGDVLFIQGSLTTVQQLVQPPGPDEGGPDDGPDAMGPDLGPNDGSGEGSDDQEARDVQGEDQYAPPGFGLRDAFGQDGEEDLGTPDYRRMATSLSLPAAMRREVLSRLLVALNPDDVLALPELYAHVPDDAVCNEAQRVTLREVSGYETDSGGHWLYASCLAGGVPSRVFLARLRLTVNPDRYLGSRVVNGVTGYADTLRVERDGGRSVRRLALPDAGPATTAEHQALRAWRSKARRHLESRGTAICAFENSGLHPIRHRYVEARLGRCDTPERINALFAEAGAAIERSVDLDAHAASTSPHNAHRPPTDGQAQAGNYRKGHITVGGVRISIENPAGSRRRPEWSPLKDHYGYVKRTEGKDGDSVDVFVRTGTDSGYDGPVFVVDQLNEERGFDEHKCMIGWPDEASARKAYFGNYSDDWPQWRAGAITELPMSEFRDWLRSGDTTKPCGDISRAAGMFDESKHPRDHGKFASKAGAQGETEIPHPALRDGFTWASPEEAKARKVRPDLRHVQISADPTSRLQAVGIDSAGRTQYLYSKEHSDQQAHAKFERIRKFNEVVSGMAVKMSADADAGNDTASALRLMFLSGFRVGGDDAQTKGSPTFGATTLRSDHVSVDGDTVHFDFIGKSGIRQQHSITDKALAVDIAKRKQEAGEGGRLFNTTDAKVRDYIAKISPEGRDFKAHDFRTWNATALAHELTQRTNPPESPREFASLRKQVAEAVGRKIGDNAATALKHYIDPHVWTHWASRLRIDPLAVSRMDAPPESPDSDAPMVGIEKIHPAMFRPVAYMHDFVSTHAYDEPASDEEIEAVPDPDELADSDPVERWMGAFEESKHPRDHGKPILTP